MSSPIRTAKILIGVSALPLLLAALYVRILVLSAWPHPGQDQCVFPSVSEQQYQTYFAQARGAVGTISSHAGTRAEVDRTKIPAMVIDDVVRPLRLRPQKIAATHAAMRALGGVLVEQTADNGGYTTLRYKLVLPNSFGVSCLIRCYALQSINITPQASYDMSTAKPVALASGIVWPSWLEGDTDDLIAKYDNEPFCPKP